MSRFEQAIDHVTLDEHLGREGSEGTKRYEAARVKALESDRAAAAHRKLTSEIDVHVDR